MAYRMGVNYPKADVARIVSPPYRYVSKIQWFCGVDRRNRNGKHVVGRETILPEGWMIDDIDRTDAIFLVARHGRAAPDIAGSHSARAGNRGDTGEARRWQAIRSFIQRSIR